MAADTKQRLCETALRLFNERGYDAVSLRQIAAEASTTIGNLTYHFSRKEDLLCSLLIDLHAGYAEMLDRGLSGSDLVARLIDLVRANERNHREYAFYFQNISRIMEESPSLRDENDTFARDASAYYEWVFESLAKDGWFNEGLRGRASHAAALGLVALQSGWDEPSSPAHNELVEAMSLSEMVCALIRMYVAPDHVAEFDAICAERGVRTDA